MDKLNLRCTRCGYGALRSSAPERCPMCQAENAWIHAPRRSSRAQLQDLAPAAAAGGAFSALQVARGVSGNS